VKKIAGLLGLCSRAGQITLGADLSLRQTEIDNLYDQLEELTAQLDEASLSLKIKDQEIQDLNNKVASLQQSAQNQGQQDGGQKELETLQMENKQLVALADDLEKQIDRLLDDRKGLEKEIADYQDKADFLDNYVVFVENNGSNLYHTYDCDDFTKSNFWAYSRKLAESQGFNPCPACKGAP
jgi:chromosome segregation ATPase